MHLQPNIDSADTFVSDPDVARELGVSLMSLWRWDHNPELVASGWPAKIQINRRNFRSRHALEEFKRAMLTRAIAERKTLFEGATAGAT
jgi:hypothetical protein